MELGIVTGETGEADGSFIPSNVSWESRYEADETVLRSTVKYMEELEEEFSAMPGYKSSEDIEENKKALKSSTQRAGAFRNQRLYSNT